MFFGAGNLLLPPFIGIQIGNHVWITILAFGLTGILLPFMGILAVVNSGDSFSDLGHRINKHLAAWLGTVIMLCIGPLIAIPRTAATTFEVGVLPSFPNSSPIWTSIGFFAITWLLTIVPSKVVDIIGNILTPLLLLLLLTLIGVGVFSPIADYSSSSLSAGQSFTLGFTEGYQTLDVLASVIFAGIIITAAKSKGYQSLKEKNVVVIASGALAAICLLLIYGGLIYLGASSGVADSTIKRSELLIHISSSVLGKYGTLAIALSIALACLTTAIALTSAVGTFFSTLTKGFLSYQILVTICCVISGILAVTGVDNIIKVAYPPLAFVYPIVITLVLYVVLFGSLVKDKLPYVAALIASTFIATLGLLKSLNIFNEEQLESLNQIPLFTYELGWVLPSFICFAVGLLISKLKTKKLAEKLNTGLENKI